MSATALLPVLAISALISLMAAAVLLVTGHATPQLAAHLAFAIGILPLILAAMGYFVPVLTRSAPARSAALWPPLLAWIAGTMAAFTFYDSFSPLGFSLAAAIGGAAAMSLGIWTLQRVQRMLGPRHRGLDWYLASLCFLLLALLAVMAMPIFPAQRDGLRLFHLHANLLGFVGLAALGTLQVLLPTCVGQADPDAAARLRTDLKWAVGGVLLIATGASTTLPAAEAGPGRYLAALGTALVAWVVLRMLTAWRSRFGKRLLQLHGAAPSLAAAGLGLLGMLLLGAMHGTGQIAARPSIAGLVVAFLLPLVSGAAAHLLPVWLRPGVQSAWHHALRARLGRWGGLRGMVLLLLGLVLTAWLSAAP